MLSRTWSHFGANNKRKNGVNQRYLCNEVTRIAMWTPFTCQTRASVLLFFHVFRAHQDKQQTQELVRIWPHKRE